MKFQDVTRFEFRAFGHDLVKVRDAFAARGSAAAQPPSSETYIVTRLNVESNVKIRAHHLEVKALQGRLRLLEQWEPIFKSAFPVAADDVENVVAPALGLEVDLADAPAFTEPTLLAWVKEEHSLAFVMVEKRRTLFDLGDSEAEFTELRIGAEELQTVAVEAPEAKAAEAVVREAGLETMANESYSIFLQRLLFAGTR